jgi:TPP-dependent pyruvate/acetoin dehydrogenase alpha subunit
VLISIVRYPCSTEYYRWLTRQLTARYRTPDELAEAARHDPIACLESLLVERGWLTTEGAERLREELDREASEAADWAERQPMPRGGSRSARLRRVAE